MFRHAFFDAISEPDDIRILGRCQPFLALSVLLDYFDVGWPTVLQGCGGLLVNVVTVLNPILVRPRHRDR